MSKSLSYPGDRLTARIEHCELLQIFVAESEELLQYPGASLGACSTLLEAACHNGMFTQIVNYEIERLIEDPDHVLTSSSEAQILVWQSPWFTLMLKHLSMPEGQKRLFGLPEEHVIAPVSAQGVRLTRYWQPEPEPNEVFDRSRGLVRKREENLTFGQGSYFKAGEDVFSIHTDTVDPPLLAFLTSPKKQTLLWEYDAVTLAPIRAVAADRSASRLEFMTWIIAETNDTGGLPGLINLLDHPAHFVRWAAVRAIFRLDSEQGLSFLRDALSDRHEHVRDAARRSLIRLSDGK